MPTSREFYDFAKYWQARLKQPDASPEILEAACLALVPAHDAGWLAGHFDAVVMRDSARLADVVVPADMVALIALKAQEVAHFAGVLMLNQPPVATWLTTALYTLVRLVGQPRPEVVEVSLTTDYERSAANPDEATQLLLVGADGRLGFAAFTFAESGAVKPRQMEKKIAPELAQVVIQTLKQAMLHPRFTGRHTNGHYAMTLTRKDGKEETYSDAVAESGPLVALAETLSKLLPIPNLWTFTGPRQVPLDALSVGLIVAGRLSESVRVTRIDASIHSVIHWGNDEVWETIHRNSSDLAARLAEVDGAALVEELKAYRRDQAADDHVMFTFTATVGDERVTIGGAFDPQAMPKAWRALVPTLAQVVGGDARRMLLFDEGADE